MIFESALFWSLIFLISLAVLIKSSDYFINISERIGLAMGLPPFIIGAILLGFGTSVPELITSIFGVIAGSSEIVLGNVVGSNIANILLILGFSAIMGKTLRIHLAAIKTELIFLVISTILLSAFIINREVNWWEALILFSGILVYTIYTVNQSLAARKFDGEIRKIKEEKEPFRWQHWIWLVLTGAGIFVGAKYTIESIIRLSSIFGVGTELLALSAVALGTSLPELVVSIIAVKKNKSDMALGNILGSNIFNSFAVTSIPRLFGAYVIPESVVFFSLPVMILATFMLLVALKNEKVTWKEGVLFTLIYVLFLAELFGGFLKSIIV